MNLGIRARVVLLGIVCALPLAAGNLYEAKRAERAALDQARKEALLLARSLAAMQDDVFDDTRNLLSGFVAAGLQGARGEDCAARLQRLLAAYPLHRNITLADEKGELVCAARPLSQAINVADRRYFREAVESKAFALSEVIISRDSGNPVLVAAHPLIDGAKRVSAVVLATFGLEELGRSFQRAGAPAYLAAYLVNGERKIVAGWPHDPRLIGRDLPVLGDAQSFDGDEGTADSPGADGVARVAAYVRMREVPGDSLYVVTAIPREEFLKQPRVALQRDLLWLAAALALALALGLAGSQLLVVRPLRRLTAATERHRTGDLAARSGVAHGGDEVGKLAAAFDELAESNQKVTRALRALSAGNRTLLRERDESQLLQEMCKVAVERGGYAVAYVCYPREDAAKSVAIMAQRGPDGGFISAVELTWADSELGQGTIGRCIRTGERSLIRSIAADPKTGPWKAAARANGFAAVISLPLRVAGALVGTFTLVAREDGFDEAEIELLDEMAADLSFGIEVIRAEARRKEAELIARRALTHDSVIDLPNRSWFAQRVVECIARGSRNREPVAVLDIHLGRLQEIVDSFGYEHGNAVLRQAAERLQGLPGAEENLGRLPVDDFGIVLCAFDADGAMRAARNALEALAAPVRIGEALIDVQAAVGIAMYPGHGAEAEILVRRASIAARDAFRRDQPYAIYSGAMARENPGRLSLAAELRAAVETRQLCLHFQPKLDLAAGGAAGCEALVRWQHPKRGMIPPIEFIGLADEIGLIRPLTYQVIDLAIRQLHGWQASGIATPIAVNLSARNLYDPGLIETLDGMFSTWGVPRSLLHFEITEGALVDDPRAARRTLERLSEHGAKIYIDDFGTGYSSLSYLVSLPVHALKIDRSFIVQMTKSAEARSLVASVISMAHKLELRVVAEGVETAADVAILQELGCDEAQGYYFSRPVATEQYEAWTRSAAAAPATIAAR